MLSLDWWTKVLTLLALIGLACIVLGRLLHTKGLPVVGICLGAPLVIGGVIIVVVIVPYVLLRGRATKR
jgi:hypothetical protein